MIIPVSSDGGLDRVAVVGGGGGEERLESQIIPESTSQSLTNV